MSINQFPKCAATNESNIPVPKRMNSGIKKSKSCKLPELQKYIETIIKASNEYDSEDTSLSDRDKFPKDRKFGKYTVYKGLDGKIKQEKTKNQLNVSRNKSNSKAKPPISEAVSRGVKVYNMFVPEFEDPRNWKLGKTQNLSPSVEVEQFLKKFYPNPYHLEKLNEFNQIKKDTEESRDGTLPDVVISNANIHTEVDIEKRENDIEAADIEPSKRESPNIKPASETNLENRPSFIISQEDAINTDIRAVSVPVLAKKSSRITSVNSTSNTSSRVSSLESITDSVYRKGSQMTLKKKKSSKSKSRHKLLKSEKVSDYDIGKLKLLHLTDSEKSICSKTHATQDEKVEDIYKSDELSDLKEICDIMYKATESFLYLNSKNNLNTTNASKVHAVSSESNKTTELYKSEEKIPNSNSSDKTENEIYATTDISEMNVTEKETEKKKENVFERSLLDVLLQEDKYEYRLNPDDRNLEQLSDQAESVSNCDLAPMEATLLDVNQLKRELNLVDTQKHDDVLNFMYSCLKKFGNKEKPPPAEGKKSLSKLGDEKPVGKSVSCKKLWKESLTDINYEKPTTSGSPKSSETDWPQKQDSNENLLSKNFPDIKEIQSKYSAALSEINKKAPKGRCKKRLSQPFTGHDSISHHQLTTVTPAVTNPITQPASYQHLVDQIYENGTGTIIQTVESQNELGSYTEASHEAFITPEDTRTPKMVCPLSVKRKKSKTNTCKTLKDVLEAEEKLLSAENAGKETKDKDEKMEGRDWKEEERTDKGERKDEESQTEKRKEKAQERQTDKGKQNEEARQVDKGKQNEEARQVDKGKQKEIGRQTEDEKTKELTTCATENQLQERNDTANVSPLEDFKRPASNFVICVNTFPRNLRSLNAIRPPLPVPFSISLSDMKGNWKVKQLTFTPKMKSLKKLVLPLQISYSALEYTYNIKQAVLLCVNKTVVAHTAQQVCLKVVSNHSKQTDEFSLENSKCLIRIMVKSVQQTVETSKENGIPALRPSPLKSEMSTEDDKPVKALIEAIEETEEKVFLLEQSSAENLFCRNSEMCSLSASDTLKNEFSELEIEKLSDKKKIHELLVRTYNLQQKLQRYLQKITCVHAPSASCPMVQEGVLNISPKNKAKIEPDVENTIPVVHWHLKPPDNEMQPKADESVAVSVSMTDRSTSYDPPVEEEKFEKTEEPNNLTIHSREGDEQFLQDTGNDEDDRSSNYSFKSSNDFSESSEARNTKKESKRSDYLSNLKFFQKIYKEIESFRRSFEADKLEKQQQAESPPPVQQEEQVDRRVTQYDPKTPAKVLRTVFTGTKSSTELTIGLKDVPMTKLGNISVEKTKFSPNHTKISVAFTKEVTEEQPNKLSYYFDHMRPSVSTCLTEYSELKDEESSKTVNEDTDDEDDEDDYKSVASRVTDTEEEKKTEVKEPKTVETPPPKNFTKHRFDFYQKMNTDFDTERLKPKSVAHSLCRYKELEPLKEALTEMQIRMRNIKRDAVFSSNDYYERALKLAKMSAGFCQSCGNRAVIPNDTFGYYRTLLPRRSAHQRRRHFRPSLTSNPSFYSLRSSNPEVGDQFCDLGIKHSSYMLNSRLQSNRTIVRSSLHDMPILFERL